MSARGRAALVIFARHPQRGRVKTRLVPPLTPDQALALHVASLQSTAALAASLSPQVELRLYLTSNSLDAARQTTRKLRLPQRLRVRVQGGGDLGARLARAFNKLGAEGYDRVVVIGSDSPTLPRRGLQSAFTALDRAEAVLGPARDGGYYLIGLRLPRRGLSRLFRGIAWGTRRTFQQTRARFRTARLRLHLLPPGDDVDTANDLIRLRRDLRRCGGAHLRPLREWFTHPGNTPPALEERDRAAPSVMDGRVRRRRPNSSSHSGSEASFR
jgi:rSAM/selenodomain-associated transferase 1